jgi:hypothetical protein
VDYPLTEYLSINSIIILENPSLHQLFQIRIISGRFTPLPPVEFPHLLTGSQITM